MLSQHLAFVEQQRGIENHDNVPIPCTSVKGAPACLLHLSFARSNASSPAQCVGGNSVPSQHHAFEEHQQGIKHHAVLPSYTLL